MTLDKSDLEALRLMMQEQTKLLKGEIAEFRTQMDAQFTEVQNNFDGLYARDEKREQEYLALSEQFKRHEERIESLEKKVA